ncbi:Protein of unknown function [Pyronema omphalodes CBS 100304]|uniref:Uncharacterized protein n=1 Tax=Pyronema omphalodes (strain CBS 100304) TaxID=1076935 RepID=U4KUJ5_PYROM|nr:Protein of unknown function [Pyronema omphalodes CBS 100304]
MPDALRPFMKALEHITQFTSVLIYHQDGKLPTLATVLQILTTTYPAPNINFRTVQEHITLLPTINDAMNETNFDEHDRNAVIAILATLQYIFGAYGDTFPWVMYLLRLFGDQLAKDYGTTPMLLA